MENKKCACGSDMRLETRELRGFVGLLWYCKDRQCIHSKVPVKG